MSDPPPGHVRVSDTSNGQIPLGGYKRPPTSYLSSLVGHSVQLVNTLRQSLELQTSLPQAPFKSKVPRRDLSLTLE
jgi:hypothetical protein